MKYITMFVFAFILCYSCNSTDEDITTDEDVIINTDEDVNTDDDAIDTIDPDIATITHRGIYINNFLTNGIIGNEAEENELLEWCTVNHFNNIYLYNIGEILSGNTKEALDPFVEKAHNKAIDVTFVSAGFGTSFEHIEQYHDDSNHLPEGIVSEIEFWNGDLNYADDYAPWIERLNSLKNDIPTGASSPRNGDLMRRFYIGKLKDVGEAPSLDIAKELVINHDEIFLTNYHTNAYDLYPHNDENAIKSKLRLLALAGKELNKTVNIVILFNVRADSPAPNILDYVSATGENNRFADPYLSFNDDYNAAQDIDHKEFLNLKGYGIYRYTDAKPSKP